MRALAILKKYFALLPFAGLLIFNNQALADNFSQQEIEQLIRKTIEIRRIDVEQYNKNLTQLQSLARDEQQGQLTIAQQEDILYLEAYQLSLKGEISQAIAKHHLIEQSTNLKNRMRSLKSQLNLYILIGDYNRTNQLVDSILADIDLLEDIKLKNEGFKMIGYYYNFLGKYQLALNYLNLVNIDSLDAGNLCVFNSYLALNYLRSKKLAANEAFIKATINDCRAINDYIVADSLVIENADHLISHGDYQIAINELLNIEDSPRLKGFYAHSISLHGLLAKAYFELEQYSLAHKHANSALGYLNKNYASEYNQLVYEVLSNLLQMAGEQQQALIYLQAVQQLKASHAHLERRKAMAGAQAKHQVQEYNRRLIKLKAENQISIDNFDDLHNANQELERLIDVNLKILAYLLLMYCLLYALLFALKAKKQKSRAF